MKARTVIVFVCEHGAAKSILAAALFNHMATEGGLDLQAVARGTNPDHELSPQTIQGLSRDGLHPTESVPQKLTLEDIGSARRIISFCKLPAEYQAKATAEQWEGVPAVSENYDIARDAILERIRHLLDEIRSPL